VVFRIAGSNETSIQGEVMALVSAALILSSRHESESQIVHSDHLQSVRLIEDIWANSLHPNFWAYKAARSYYRWLHNILSHNTSAAFQHVKAHTSATDVPSRLNRVADAAAISAHYRPSLVPLAPLPTFFMDNFSLWCPLVGFIENNSLTFISAHLSQQVAHRLFFDSNQRMPGLEALTPPTYPYERSSAGYSASVQLYARSGQLPTRALLASRGLISSSRCRFGCCAAESAQHLFSTCSIFHSFRESTLADLHRTSSALLEDVPLSISVRILDVIPSLLSPSSPLEWPHGSNQWYLGHIPFIKRFCPLLQPRFVSRLSHVWHSAFIHLAARIWGFVQRLASSR
jgi:hypothetical protein